MYKEGDAPLEKTPNISRLRDQRGKGRKGLRFLGSPSSGGGALFCPELPRKKLGLLRRPNAVCGQQ